MKGSFLWILRVQMTKWPIIPLQAKGFLQCLRCIMSSIALRDRCKAAFRNRDGMT